jgi:replicative superfamily II helicase
MSVSLDATKRMLNLAADQRLLCNIDVEPAVVDQTHIMRLAERRVYEFTKTKTGSQLRTEAKAIFTSIQDILEPFVFKQKQAFLDLWAFVLLNQGTPESVKTCLESIKSVAHNNKLKRLILPQLQTAAKYVGIVKHVLNVGKEFQSLFDEVDLTSSELILRDRAKEHESAMEHALKIFLTTLSFDKTATELIRTFYDCVSELSDPELRNYYFNQFLVQLCKQPKVTMSLTNLFVQLYDRLINHELVVTVDPVVTSWLLANPINFTTHCLQHLSLQLPPYDTFQKPQVVLDDWQREALLEIKKGHHVCLFTPTSSGKTMMASAAMENNESVLYIQPEKPVAEQFASIVVATLEDQERRKGATVRNVRLELDQRQKNPYRRYPTKKDNVIVGQPQRVVGLIKAGKLGIEPGCVVLDEFHNINDPMMGPAYQYLLYWAAFHGKQVIVLSASIPNYDEVNPWIRRVLTGPLFSVHLTKRFFNQRRLVFKVEDHKVTLKTLNPLDHLQSETLTSSTFRHPGLVPTEFLKFYQSVPTFPRLEDRSKVPTMDDVETWEHALFKHIALLPPAQQASYIKDTPVPCDQLTLHQIVVTLRTLNDTHKPLLLFKMDSEACLRRYYDIIKCLKAENDLVYGDFQADQPIIQAYLAEVEDMSPEKVGGSGEEAERQAEAFQVKLQGLFASKYLKQLQRFYEDYQTPKPDVAAMEAFNTTFGGNITHEYILRKRAEHVQEQNLYSSELYKNIKLRDGYTLHDKIKITNYSGGSIMKEIKRQLEGELSFQRAQLGPFSLLDPEFSEFDEITETCYYRVWDDKDYKWVRTGEMLAHRLGWPWPQGRPQNDHCEYEYSLSYEHPILVGIECGLLFNNALLNPAFNYMCQLLIGKHPLVTISDHTYTTGVNFPYRTVWIHGSLKGEAREDMANERFWQAAGRGGRRGLFKMAMIILDGLVTERLLFPKFHPVGKNTEEAMASLMDKESEDFATFMRTETRPAPKVIISVPKAPESKQPAPMPIAPITNTVVSESAVEENKTEPMTWEDFAASLV